MEFDELFEGKSWPETPERLGVMSIDTLNRLWEPVLDEGGYLIAKSKDGKDALLGRMCKRDDGKFCVELVVRATINKNTIQDVRLWFADATDGPRYVEWLREVIQRHLIS